MARLNTQTVERNTEEVRALSAFREEQGKLADASLERDRKVEHYLKHRDDILLDDYEQHRDQMRTNRIERAEAQEEGEHRRQLAREKRKQELANTLTTWWRPASNEASATLLPHLPGLYLNPRHDHAAPTNFRLLPRARVPRSPSRS